ncbi:class II fructose-bisphosphatase [Candidatus Pelagibacter sp. RS39]|uniref:class II fructose-bisphosphatase n=1 Tax=Candidatus Pelagibacter sp. RS39 TaxID=1977864 RepID=UPI000A15C7F7|nr:class II fructose-bisphosphatase [Candidatus Pelagibacter sp. RS39]ARJ47877.1 fructose-bisphosphatase class II [Candidatus Pelagibacter sp. RS39]
MALNKELINDIITVTSKAAISCYDFIGKNQKKNADKAATDSMRNEINKLSINGEVVIGEGELDNAPMLYIGEKLGSGGNINLDIAVDPVEGTNFVAKNLPGALSVISVAEKGNLFNAPETYMDKIAVSNKIPFEATDLDFSVEKNIKNIADSLNKDLTNITACLLDRPRHKKIIDELIRMKVKMRLISDGDVSGALMVTDDKYDVDIFLGIGGGPEGVLAASAIDAYQCKFQGRFIFDNDKEIERAKKMGIKDLNKKYDLNEIIKGDSIFCATGITSGDLVKGINLKDNKYITQTLVTHKSSNTCKIVTREDTIKT